MLKKENLNKRVQELLIEAGYSDNELDPRANKLIELLIEECRDIVAEVYRKTPIEICGYLLSVDEEICKKLYEVN